MRTLGIFVFFSLLAQAAPEWKAGTAATAITPTKPIWMAGYAARTQPSQGASQDIYAKALALEDRSGKRAVLITTDLLGLTAQVAGNVARRLEEQHGLARDRVLMNSSHTHCGPVIGRMLGVAYNLDAKQWADIDEYTRQLEDKIVQTAGAALGALKPARLSFGHSEAGFAKNRRVQFSPNGPVDHDVPILRVEDGSGHLFAAVFGYACHNTTLPATECRIHGDYAGVAQAELEKKYPGVQAMFVAGCGADANPSPRGTLEHVRAYGDELAGAVSRTIAGPLRPVRGPLRSAFERIPLAFAEPPSKAEWQQRLSDKNEYVARHARAMLDILERNGRLPAEYPYPIQVWQFGNDLTWIALGGEVVVDYALRLKRIFGPEKLWVSGYSNDVFAYIPSLRVLQEGGYEGEGAMIYYVQPGPWAPSVEENIISATERLVRSVRSK
jgi:neutral ceramidase